MPVRRFIVGALVASIAALFIAFVIVAWQTGSHGLTRTLAGETGDTRVDRWAWPYIDGADFDLDDLKHSWRRITFDGYVWQGTAEQTLWHVVYSGDVSIQVNGKTVVYTPAPEHLTTSEITVIPDHGWLSLHVEYLVDLRAQPASVPSRLEFGIYKQGIGGRWELLSSHRLYSSLPDRAVAERDDRLSTFMTIVIPGLLAVILGLALFQIWQVRLWRKRSLYGIAALIAAAFVVRLILLNDRATSDPFFYWLPPGGDDNYMVLARQLIVGRYQLAGTLLQPGNILWLAVIVIVAGPHLFTAYLINAAISSLGVGAVVGAGWLAFGRRTAIISGVFAALYPPLIFYQVTLQTAPLDALSIALAMLIGVWALQRNSRSGIALLGVIAGLATLFRTTNGLIIVAFLLGLYFRKSSSLSGYRQFLSHGAIAVFSMLLVLAPQMFINASVGVFSPTSNNGPHTLFAGNNRDTDGTWANRGMVFDAVERAGGHWMSALLDDARTDPLHAVELMLRKIGMFWDNQELMSNVNYEASGLALSPLLRTLSLDGRVGMAALAGLAWIGIVVLVLDSRYRRDPSTIFLISLTILSILGIASFVLAGRLRVPVITLLCVMGGVTVDRSLTAVRHVSYRRSLIAGVIVSSVLLLAMNMAAQRLPGKRFFYSAPPADMVQRNANFDDQLELLGFSNPQSEHQPGGFIYLTLYWKALRPIPQDYSVFIELVDLEGKPFANTDRVLGMVGYPPVGTSQWPQGAILAESLLLELPQNVPLLSDVDVGVYHRQTLKRLPLMDTSGKPSQANFVHLFRFGIATPNDVSSLPETAAKVDFFFGDALHLTAYDVPTHISRKDKLTFTVQLEAIKPIWEDYTLGFYLLDQQGKVVTQSDSPNLGDDWTTSALLSGHPKAVTRTLDLPDDLPAGAYRFLMGFYSYPSMERLPARDSARNLLPGNLVELAQLQITP